MPGNSEEVAMLLNAYQQAARRDANHRIEQRRRSLRTVFWVIAAVALVVGCTAVVDVVVFSENGVETTTLNARAGASDDQPVAMESQFGWSSIGNGWCSLRSSAWCMFSKDKKSCEENMTCNKTNSTSGKGSNGSASGDNDQNATTVGDNWKEGGGDDVPNEDTGSDNDED